MPRVWGGTILVSAHVTPARLDRHLWLAGFAMSGFTDPDRSGPGGIHRHGAVLGFDFTMAFQPIIDIDRRDVFSYEALVRGLTGEGAAHVLAHVTNDNRYTFDQVCRLKALALGTRLGVTTRLDINFMPNALGRAETCLRTTMLAARHYHFPPERIVFEATECERIEDGGRAAEVIRECQGLGLRIAIDDFGAGYSGLNLLADLHPDLIKLDIGLCRGIDRSRLRRAIVHGVLVTCRDLEIEVVAEGVETSGELAALRDLGVRYFQGFLFARPAFERLPEVHWPGQAA
jgi:EAL domain-containing protein (putative c-di-GMP-specific phosphodiesterase class I)